MPTVLPGAETPLGNLLAPSRTVILLGLYPWWRRAAVLAARGRCTLRTYVRHHYGIITARCRDRGSYARNSLARAERAGLRASTCGRSGWFRSRSTFQIQYRRSRRGLGGWEGLAMHIRITTLKVGVVLRATSGDIHMLGTWGLDQDWGGRLAPTAGREMSRGMSQLLTREVSGRYGGGCVCVECARSHLIP